MPKSAFDPSWVLRLVRRFMRPFALGKIWLYGTGPPRSLSRREISACGILYGPISWLYSPETKNWLWSVPPLTCAPNLPTLPFTIGVRPDLFRTLPWYVLSILHVPAACCVNWHCESVPLVLCWNEI